MTTTDNAAATRAGMWATYAAFILTGFVFASWASRIPQVRDRLGLSPAEVGFVLLAIAFGSLIALPLSGGLVHRFGSRRTVATLAVGDGMAVAVVAVGYRFGVVPVVLGLAMFGFCQGGWDVAMNVQGAEVERRLGRAIMPRFHAGFSVGTVAGALLGSAAVATDVSVTTHLLVVAAVVALVVPWAVRGFVPDGHEEHEGDDAGPVGSSRTLRAWREPRTLLVGLFVLTFAFAEGTGNDWVGLAMIDGYGVEAALGTLVFAGFLAAMTAGRWFGPGLLDRYGRVPVCRAMAAVSLVGVLLFVWGGMTEVAFAGALLWGFGLSLGFPVGMSAAADESGMAPARVSVVASLGYCAFLAGPPLVGFLGEAFTVLSAMTAVAVALLLGTLLSSSVRPL
ncbi:MFS transporter [Spongisporangium articulatum]|uniref:MFS transporter n=1 Tax=Spongisporangium articulatum TaxID=3362603 RepID=A0ABW8AKY3_9ACTN